MRYNGFSMKAVKKGPFRYFSSSPSPKNFCIPVRGTKDYLPSESLLKNRIISDFTSIVERAGFDYVETPILEKSSTFIRGLGDGSDVVMKEMYHVISNHSDASSSTEDESLTLRPEGTAGLMRALINSGRLIESTPQKLYYSGKMFRHERPQKGRFREFSQVGIEAINAASVSSDVEAVITAVRFLEAVKMDFQSSASLTVQINTLGDDSSKYIQYLTEYLSAYRGELSKDSANRLERGAILRILDSKSPQDQSILENARPLIEFLSTNSVARFESVLKSLDAVGIQHSVEPRLVRGLDYYSHTVFEVVATSDEAGLGGKVGQVGTLLAGGRYDGLSKQLGFKSAVPAIGWAAGVERVMTFFMEELEKSKRSSGFSSDDIALIGRRKRVGILPAMYTDDDHIYSEVNNRIMQEVSKVSTLLNRDEIDYIIIEPHKKIRHLMNRAVSSGCDRFIIIGEDEVKNGSLVVKVNGVNKTVPFIEFNSSILK